jgi:hypothetical protein
MIVFLRSEHVRRPTNREVKPSRRSRGPRVRIPWWGSSLLLLLQLEATGVIEISLAAVEGMQRAWAIKKRKSKIFLWISEPFNLSVFKPSVGLLPWDKILVEGGTERGVPHSL